MQPLGFRIVLCTRRDETFEAAKAERLKVSGNPSQYDDLGIFIREQENIAGWQPNRSCQFLRWMSAMIMSTALLIRLPIGWSRLVDFTWMSERKGDGAKIIHVKRLFDLRTIIQGIIQKKNYKLITYRRRNNGLVVDLTYFYHHCIDCLVAAFAPN